MKKEELKKLALRYSRKEKISIKINAPLKRKKDLSLAYTPGIAEVSKLIEKKPEEMFNYTFRRNNLAVISEGSAVLGLGNIGHKAAFPVMEGKAMLFKKFADINAIPLVIKTQEPEKFIETVKEIADSFAAINLEDIAAPNCFIVEERLQKELDIPLMHDDQHGTATVVLAALLRALKILPKQGLKSRIVVSGAGAAGLAVTNLLLNYGFEEIIVLDSKGAIYQGRSHLNPYKEKIALKTNKGKIKGGLAETLKGRDIFIGVSKGGILKPQWIKLMEKEPIIIAMANPIPEIMPPLAKKAGAGIVASGRSDFPNQVNNALAFPGIFRGAIDKRARITEKMLLAAAGTISNYKREKLARENLMPSILDKNIHQKIAKAVRRAA